LNLFLIISFSGLLYKKERMSKAFTSESDETEDVLVPPPLPPGVKNYMTPQGAARLAAEIKRLQDAKDRLNPQDALARSEREKMVARLIYLVQRFDAVHIIDPLLQPHDRALFGARVTISDAAGSVEAWRIVGIDEADLNHGDISWMSPLASAILDKKVNDRVTFLQRTLIILSIEYS
jgi:transcription elongation factor GreB